MALLSRSESLLVLDQPISNPSMRSFALASMSRAALTGLPSRSTYNANPEGTSWFRARPGEVMTMLPREPSEGMSVVSWTWTILCAERCVDLDRVFWANRGQAESQHTYAVWTR